MKEIQLPQNIEINEKNDNSAIIVIEPLYPGYGLTLGNALRRVLISSLPGAAVTAIKIKNVKHEFSSLPHIKEDIVDLILNIKLIRLKLLQGDSSTMTLKVKGEKEVTAKDIKTPSEIEIVNKDLKIASLTDKNAELEIDFIVKSGLGYSPIESREKEKLEIGLIAIDSIFTPVLKARFEIENVRVGKITNYDKLTLEIKTDGTMSPSEAFQQSAKILVDHFSTLSKTKKTKTGAKNDSPSKDSKGKNDAEKKDSENEAEKEDKAKKDKDNK